MKYLLANMNYQRHDSPHGPNGNYPTIINENDNQRTPAVRKVSDTCEEVNGRDASRQNEDGPASGTASRRARSESQNFSPPNKNLQQNMTQPKGYKNPQGRTSLSALFASIYGERFVTGTSQDSMEFKIDEEVSISDHVRMALVM